jgi:hypothetical protein
MEFTTEQAKSIFVLIKDVSLYAYPLLISLIFPIIWVTLKKLLGISNSSENAITTTNPLKRILSKIGSTIALRGDSGDKVVFYFSVVLFIFGSILLKEGEKNEELIRQKALGLKKYFEAQNYIYESTNNLKDKGYSIKLQREILYNYPNEFISTDKETIRCIDTIVIQNINRIVYPLLDSYLKEKLKELRIVCVNDLFQERNRNIKKFFNPEIVYGFLSLPKNKDRYIITVLNEDDVIMAGDSLK